MPDREERQGVREIASACEPPFSRIETLQSEAMVTVERLLNLIGLERSIAWADDVRRLAATAQAEIDAMLEAI